MSKAVACCAPALKAQLQPYLDAKLPIFAMGKWAWRAINQLQQVKMPKGGLKKGRGFVRTLPNGSKLIATWHPTYAFFHNPYEWGAFQLDLDRFGRLLLASLRPGPVALITRPTLRDIQAVVQGGYVACDIETAPATKDQPWTGKDPTRALIRTMGLGNESWGLSFRVIPENQHLFNAVRTMLERPDIVSVWQNGAWFDHRILRRYGFKFPRWEDIRDARKAISTTSPISLAYMASLYDDCIPWKQMGEDEDDDKGIIFTDDFEELMRYNAQDCVETMRVWAAIVTEPEWLSERIQHIYTLRKQMAVIAASMHTRGVYVDKRKRKALDRLLNYAVKVRLPVLLKLVNNPKFRGTPDDMRALLFKRHERPDLKRFSLQDPVEHDFWTETGAIRVNQAHLLALITNPLVPPEAKEIIRAFWRVGAPRKARSTFVTSKLVDQAIGLDGRLRAGWNSGAPETMRWACSEPNLMTLSKDKDD